MRSYCFHLAAILIASVLFSASSCEGNDPFIDTPEEEAARILANTPTELPPITTTGENTMGAWIIPQPGSELHRLAGQDSILFVASGVERIDPIGASSTDCNAFQNYRYESLGYVSIRGFWCSRPEIGDDKSQSVRIALYDNGEISVSYDVDINGGSSLDQLKFRTDTTDQFSYALLRNDDNERVLSLTLDSVNLTGWRNTTETITIRNLVVDATYGSTP